MGLKSRIFKGDPVFEACLVRDDAHITPGAVGKHVGKIQTALFRLDNLDVSDDERKHRRYGHSTVKAVLAYKDNKKRKIINTSYESHVDPIVGKRTIAWLDREMFDWENNPEDVRLGVYDRMNETLFMASRPGNRFQLFLPSSGYPGEPGDPAYTTLGGYYYGMDEIEPVSDEYERAIYITPEFTNKVFAASILIHELAHYCGGKEGTADTIEHWASPKPPPRGRRLEDGLHDYAGMTADETYRNAQSYQAYCFPESLGKPPETL
jgi:hypothetical protein